MHYLLRKRKTNREYTLDGYTKIILNVERANPHFLICRALSGYKRFVSNKEETPK